MSDSERDEIDRFEEARDQSLFDKAGLGSKRRTDDFELSDEEVLGLSDGESSSDENQQEYYDEAEKKTSRLEKLNDWGASRDNYYGGGDEIGQEDDASADEEAEALSIQRKQLDAMDDADFYEEDDIEGWKKEADQHDLSGALTQTEALPDQDPSSLTPAERLEFIEENYPEVILLSRELQKCLDSQKELASKELDEKILNIQSTALRSYIAIIYAFFALFTDKVKDGPVDLKEHPVMNSILKARELWRTAQRLDSASIPDEDEEEIEDEGEDALVEALTSKTSEDKPEIIAEGGDKDTYSLSEYSASDMSIDSEDDDVASESESDDADEFDIPLTTTKKTTQLNRSRNDFDETADTIEQQARLKNKQSLRFYTSQIGKEKKNKSEEFEGDLDLPYKERAFERRQRLLEEARKRGQEAKDQLGEFNDDENDDETVGADADDNSLYARVQRERDDLKEKKATQQRDAAEAAKQGRLEEYLAENPSVDKRAINYMIQKNKGLTKKRKKEDRNARVKKRVRYEQAKKRLKGTRRVYEQPTGAYAGELTGIRKNLTHSTRFQN